MRRQFLGGLLVSLLVAGSAGATTGPGPSGGPVTGPRPDREPRLSAPLPAPPGQTLLVSRRPNGSFPDAGSIEPSASADGRYVAFTSIASNLVAGDEANTQDVFVLDRRSGQMTRVPRPGGGAGKASEPSISADGKVVAFTWQTTSGFSGALLSYVFSWVRGSQVVKPVSTTAKGTPAPGARQPSTSQDGRYVAYTSTLDVPGDQDNGADDVLRFDRKTGQTLLISSGPQGHPIAGVANQPSISGDGNLVVFSSDGGDTLVQQPTGQGTQVYVRNVAAARTDEVSLAAGGGAPGGQANDAAISQDGRFVAFASTSTDLVPGGVATQVPMVYRRELATGTTVLVSVQPDQTTPSQGPAGQPAITADGGMVAFASQASDLVPETAGRVAPAAAVIQLNDIYIRDIAAGETVLASVTLDRTGTGLKSLQPAVAGLGRLVFFASSSDRLVTKDGNKAVDVFVRDMPPQPVLSPPLLDLGAAAVGTQTPPAAVTLGNAGWASLQVAGSAIGGTNRKDFRIVADGCTGRTLRRNEACTVTVVFKPTGPGARGASLTIDDGLASTNLAVSLRGRASRAKLVVTPHIGQPGTVVIVDGSGFPDGAKVTLRWSQGITWRMAPITATGGTFHVPMLIFHNDLTGPRDLIAAPLDGTSFPAISAPVLVTQPSVIPPTFLIAPRFVDIPLVLVIR